MKPTFLLTSLAALTLGISAIQTAGQTPCTTTLTLPAPTINLSPTTTVYDSTVISTSTVNCHGCILQTTTLFLGHGPVKPSPTKTVTESTSVSETYVCHVSPVPLRFAA